MDGVIISDLRSSLLVVLGENQKEGRTEGSFKKMEKFAV